MFAHFGNRCSNKVFLINGDKQRVVISPMLFKLYMDDLNLTPDCFGAEEYIENYVINELCYADDLRIISLSSSDMQHIVNMYNKYTCTPIIR